MKSIMLPLFLTFTLLGAFGQNKAPANKYSWQSEDTSCNQEMTFCWYGGDEITAWGNRWASHDKSEKVIESVLEIRCLKSLGFCIVAYNKPIMGKTLTGIDLDPIREWSDSQIRADAEGANVYPKCEHDSILINRADASVMLIASAGADANGKSCTGLFGSPKTVIYELQQ